MPDIVTTQVFTDGEKGITAGKMNNIIANSVIQPEFVTTKPSSSTLDPTDQLLEVKGAGTYARITGSQLISSVSAQVDATPQIYSVRLRSFNAVGNPNFEVDQRYVGNAVVSPGGGTLIMDRWMKGGNGTYTVNCTQAGGNILVPGTNFLITGKYFSLLLTAQEASLGATDWLGIRQLPEGIVMRELLGDVHSISLMVACTVAPLTFAVALRDAAATPTRSLIKLCTISTANVWTLITLPNLPVWSAGGTFNRTPGSQGYDLSVTLACGSTVTAPAADTWQNGNFVGAPGMSNFCASPINSIFQLGFVQHEPGALCTTLQDCSFQQNYDACLRYYQKSYDYDVLPGTATAPGLCTLWQQSTTAVQGPIRFHKPMAKVPTIQGYNYATGALNSIRVNAVDYAISSFGTVGKSGFSGVTTATLPAVTAGSTGFLHYTADTGW
jgi:hypothetical protein